MPEEKEICILIVDDDKDVAESTQTYFKLEGFKVITAHTGTVAKEIRLANEVDIAFIDLALHDTRGDQLFRELKEISPKIKCVIITGNASLETAIEAVRQDGVIGYEVKPFDLEKLLVLIRGAISHMRAEESLKTSREQLRALSHKIIASQEEERARLSRELHDNIGKFLTALSLETEWLEQLPEIKSENLSKMGALVDNATAEIRALCKVFAPWRWTTWGSPSP